MVRRGESTHAAFTARMKQSLNRLQSFLPSSSTGYFFSSSDRRCPSTSASERSAGHGLFWIHLSA